MNRVLHVVGSMNRAGAETMLMNLYRKLDRSRFQFDFVYFTEDICAFDDEIATLGGRIFSIPNKISTNPIKRTFALKSLIKKEGPFHSIHCHQLFSNSLHLIAGYLAGIKMRIAHSHSTSDIANNTRIGKAYQLFSKLIISKFATHFIACGKDASNFLFPNNKDVMLLPNAILFDNFIKPIDKSPNNVFNTNNISDKTIIISQIGRLTLLKNHTFTLKLAQFLERKGLDFHFVIVGNGPLDSDLKLLAKDLSIESKVTFTGVRSDINVILANSDIMIMPSLYEGFPVVLVESQASGIPAVISSSISTEVDLGMGLVHFCSLEAKLDSWYNKINEALGQTKVNPEIRKGVLSNKGYNIDLSIKKLEKFYEKG